MKMIMYLVFIMTFAFLLKKEDVSDINTYLFIIVILLILIVSELIELNQTK